MQLYLPYFVGVLLLALAHNAGAAPAAAAPCADPGGAIAAYLSAEQPAGSADLSAVRRFYELRRYAPAWHRQDTGDLLPAADQMLRAIEDSRLHGLEPSSYGLQQLTQLRAAPGMESCVRMDVALTGAFLQLAADLDHGRFAPGDADPDWHIKRDEFDAVDYLSRALSGDDIHRALYALAPQHPGYLQLLRMLASYREIEADGGWPQIEEGPSLRSGDRGPRVAVLRQRLQVEGYPAGSGPEDPQVFGAGLDRAVREFQAQYTLADDGVVGKTTLAALNTPVQARILQIRLNLERWRWLPRDFGHRYLMVNVPGYVLEGYADGRRALAMDVIVGRPDRPTAFLRGRFTHIVVNPYWDVPPTIVEKDMIPAQIRDPHYLASRHIRVLKGTGADAVELDPAAIDWRAFRHGNFPYLMRQDPGPENAMGRIKFPLGNAYFIYLHDTPERRLFQRAQRSLSSGCVRVADAGDLALFLLDGAAAWDAGRLRSLIASGETVDQPLAEPVPVFIVYFTAWAEAGTQFFANDIYQRDDKLAELLVGG